MSSFCRIARTFAFGIIVWTLFDYGFAVFNLDFWVIVTCIFLIRFSSELEK